MLLVNDERTENGGLIHKGFVGPDGKADAGLSLTVDRCRHDQVIQLLRAEGGGGAREACWCAANMFLSPHTQVKVAITAVL